MLTIRWYPLDYVKPQRLLWGCQSRFVVVPSGRRSGKTELAKRKLVKKAISFFDYPDGMFVYAAPTHLQAKRIAWKDLKDLVPERYLLGNKDNSISESELTIKLYNGAQIMVVGMDAPSRIEGIAIDFIVVDEYGNMKPEVWTHHIRPCLSNKNRLGSAWLIGVPEGRNHYYQLAMKARTNVGQWKDWEYFHWKSSEVIDPEEIRAVRDELDELTFQQEYEGSFINFTGRCYYGFDREIHAAETLSYNEELPLIFTFDFNREPGVCGIIQEQNYTGNNPDVSKNITAIIDEVYIPKNSNTERVCDKLISDWKYHKGDVYLYGDASGGSGGSAKIMGSDWDLVYNKLGPVFGDSLHERYKSSNPNVRSRINATNTRIQNYSKKISLLVDPNCVNTIEDFEGVTLIEGGTGEIDKKKDLRLTHLTDAYGYYIETEFPVIHDTGSLQSQL